LLGADADKGRAHYSHYMRTHTPLVLCWLSSDHDRRPGASTARVAITDLLMACGAKLTPDNINAVTVVVRDVAQEDQVALRSLTERCSRPLSLRTMSSSVVRQCLASHEPIGVIKNTDRLPLPSTVKATIKLQDIDTPPTPE